MNKRWIGNLGWLGWVCVCAVVGPSWALDPVPAATAAAATVVAAAPIPVLCYHRFGAYPATDPYFVTVEEFKHQLEIVKEEGFTPVTASDLAEGRAGRKPLPAKPILITIDDGYRDVAVRALPVLKGFGYPATLFVYPSFIDSRQGLSLEQLRQLRAEGWEIGSHSYTHPKLTKPEVAETPEQYAKRLAWELEGSRLKLEEWLGTTVTALAYPYGLWNTAVADAARAAGYRIMFTVDQGTNDAATPLDRQKRIMVLHGAKDSTFRFLLQDEPLTLIARSPEVGGSSSGPLTRLTATMAPELFASLDPKSIRALFGGVPTQVSLEPEQSRVLIDLARPWTRGTNAVMLVAKDAAHRRHYKESWLVTVTPAKPQ